MGELSMSGLAPKDARKFTQVCELQTASHDTKGYWIMLDAGDKSHDVIIKAQKSGELPTQAITIPRRDFLALIRWYQTPQRKRVRK